MSQAKKPKDILDNLEPPPPPTPNFNIPPTGLENLGKMASSRVNAFPSTENAATNQARQAQSTNTPSFANLGEVIQQKLKKDIRRRVRETIPEPKVQHETSIYNEGDFKVKMEAYLALNYRKVPAGSVDDFPTDDPAAQRRLAEGLVDAMLNTDKDTLVDPQAKLPFNRINKLSPFELDLMAWTVLLETRDVQRGKISLPSWGKERELENFSSFTARLEAVRKSLYHCKAMVASLFDEVFARRLPLNPTAELSRKDNNKKLNQKRKVALEQAKRVAEKRAVLPRMRRIIGDLSSAARRSSSPESTRPEPHPEPSASPARKRRKTSRRAAEDQDFFDLEQNSGFSAKGPEESQFGQNSTADDLDSSFSTPDEVGSSHNESTFTQNYTPEASLLWGSQVRSQTGRRRTETEGVGGSDATQRSLSGSDIRQWTATNFAPSSQKPRRATGSSLGQGAFSPAQTSPASSGHWAGRANIPPSQNEPVVVQGGKRRTMGNPTVQPFTQRVTERGEQQPAATPSQRRPLPTMRLRNPHQAPSQLEQGLGAPIQQQPGQYLPQGQAVYRNAPSTSIIDVPVIEEELDRVLSMSDFFDVELSVWKDISGNVVEFGGFQAP